MKRRLTALCLAAGMVISSISMAACGGSNGSNASGSSSAEESGEASGDAAEKYKGETLTVVGWGGALEDAQREAIFKPFEEKYGVKINEVNPTDYSTVKAMCESGKIDYDVVNVQPDFAIRMKDYLEPLDWNIIDKTDFDEKWYNDYYVASDLYSTSIVYNTKEFSGDHPSSWADVWDTTKYPGKRTFWDYPTGMLEAALLADGVKAEDLYPLDVDRAFKKMDEIKPNVVKWWDTGAESIQLISNDESSVGAIWGSRVAEAKSQGQPVEIESNQGIIGADAWVVLKGDEKKDLAMEFINFATRPEQMAAFMKLYPNGSVNVKAYDLLDQDTLDGLATNPEKGKTQIMMDDNWWVENGDDVIARYTKWRLQ